MWVMTNLLLQPRRFRDLSVLPKRRFQPTVCLNRGPALQFAVLLWVRNADALALVTPAQSDHAMMWAVGPLSSDA